MKTQQRALMQFEQTLNTFRTDTDTGKESLQALYAADRELGERILRCNQLIAEQKIQVTALGVSIGKHISELGKQVDSKLADFSTKLRRLDDKINGNVKTNVSFQ